LVLFLTDLEPHEWKEMFADGLGCPELDRQTMFNKEKAPARDRGISGAEIEA
jgi:hypothetical protein